MDLRPGGLSPTVPWSTANQIRRHYPDFGKLCQ